MNYNNILKNLATHPVRTGRRIYRQFPQRFAQLKKEFRRFQSRRIQLQPSAKAAVSLDERENALASALDLIRSFDREVPVKTITDHFFDEPIVPNRVVIIGLGKGVRGNFQYILNELNYSADFEGFEIYVRTAPETDAAVNDFIRNNHWTRTRTVPKDGDYAKIMESSKYLITETFFSEAWAKKDGQIYINIWHGTPLKKLGQAKQFRNRHRDGNTQRNFIEADYLMYPNSHTKKCMLDSYGVKQLLGGQILMNGYPRTGGMLAAKADYDPEFHRFLAPNGEHIYAYMPTFRDYYSLEKCVEQSRDLLDYLDQNLCDDQILYVNLHHKLNDVIDYSVYRHIRKFPAGIDSYKLLAYTDALISDYSSVFFDYLALSQQIILLVDDWKTYKKKRGVYLELKDLPFDMASKKENVLDAINQGKARKEDGTYEAYYSKKYQNAFHKFCSYDSADNAAHIGQLISQKTDGLNLEPIKKNARKKVLIYSESFGPVGSTERLLDLTRAFDKKLADLYLSCDSRKPTSTRDSAYPLLFEHTVIGTDDNPHFSAAGKVLMDLYHDGLIPFEQAMSLLRYDYSVMLLRIYGHTSFDTVLIYDVDNPDKLIALSQMNASKVLFLPEHILEKLRCGDRYLKDAICYAAGRCNAVFVDSKEQIAEAKKILSGSWSGKIHVLKNIEDFEHLLTL